MSKYSRGKYYAESRLTKRSKLIRDRKMIGHFCQYCGYIAKSGPLLGSHVRNCKNNPSYSAMISKIKTKAQNRVISDETRKKLSDTIQSKVKSGNWHYSFSRTKTYTYRGIRFHGNWELQYAKFLDKSKIKWSRPRIGFEYLFEGKVRFYYPDFYLIDTNTYVEIKGYKTKKDEAKWKYFPHVLKILRGKDLYRMGVINKLQLQGKE